MNSIIVSSESPLVSFHFSFSNPLKKILVLEGPLLQLHFEFHAYSKMQRGHRHDIYNAATE